MKSKSTQHEVNSHLTMSQTISEEKEGTVEAEHYIASTKHAVAGCHPPWIMPSTALHTHHVKSVHALRLVKHMHGMVYIASTNTYTAIVTSY